MVEVSFSPAPSSGTTMSFARNLRIIDDFLRLTHGAEGDVNAVEDLIPMRHWLRTKDLIEHCRQLRPVLRQLGGIRESRVREDILTTHCFQNRGYLVRSGYKNEPVPSEERYVFKAAFAGWVRSCSP
jgi:hypothetical protein